ncbi:zeatin O-glucosyltransferase [Morus notabilis]|nr:zeatin O-glucosyltransferase [Morus notabilis]
MNQSSSPSVVVVMVPFPAQSHLNQLLQLSHLIISSNNNLPIHYLASPAHNSQVKSRSLVTNYANNSNPNFVFNTKIIFHDLPIPLPSLLPTTSPDLLHKPMAALLHSLAPTATRLVILSLLSPFNGSPSEELGYKLPCRDECFPPDINRYLDHRARCMKPRGNGYISNSCRSIEAAFLDLLENDKELLGGKKIWAVGPLNPVTLELVNYRQEDKCLEWLDQQEVNSALYISFGTTITLKDEEIKQMALGLEQSGIKFIWVLRAAGDQEDVKRAQLLPNGFEERVKGMGMVVRDWAPQMKILGHSSTGGFLSHCGWNSCMESISMGVPMAVWPMKSDQPRNAVLITLVLKVGFVVREWEKREELVSSSRISDVVEILMKSEEGNEVRKRAEELGYEVRKSVEEGVTRKEWDSFIAHITRETC